MNKKLLFVAATAISIALSGIASAATQINGSVSLSGGVTSFAAGPPITITFGALGNLDSASGDFTTAFGPNVLPNICAACVNFPTSPFAANTPLPANVFVITFNGNVATATLNTAAFSLTNNGTLSQLTILGSGFVNLTNFLQTPMDFILTANRSGTTFSMSASAGAVPQVPIPGALPLFATGIVGLWALGRKRKKQKQLESAAA